MSIHLEDTLITGCEPGTKGATVNAIRILQKFHESTVSVPQQTNEFDAEDDTPITIKLRVSEGERSHLIFMLDNGASVNIVKLKALDGSLSIDTSKALKIGSITPESLRTIGTVNLTILKKTLCPSCSQ